MTEQPTELEKPLDLMANVTTMKSAFDEVDDLYQKKVPLLGINKEGITGNNILLDPHNKNIPLFWASKERELWAIMAVCGIYFLFVLMTGGF